MQERTFGLGWTSSWPDPCRTFVGEGMNVRIGGMNGRRLNGRVLSTKAKARSPIGSVTLTFAKSQAMSMLLTKFSARAATSSWHLDSFLTSKTTGMSRA